MLTLDYVAGVMDADGHFTWRGGRYQCPDVGVTNTSSALMTALTDTFGGSAAPQRYVCSPDCADTSNGHYHRRSDVWKWHLTGYAAVLLCEALASRLVIKGDKARDLAARYRTTLDTMQRPARRRHHMAREEAAWRERGLPLV